MRQPVVEVQGCSIIENLRKSNPLSFWEEQIDIFQMKKVSCIFDCTGLLDLLT